MITRLITALLIATCLPALAADNAPLVNRFAASVVPAERFQVGATLVERHGKGGSPLILIPGLGSGPWVWQDTLRRLADQHVVYVLTLPGFDGHPAVAGAGMEAAEQSVRELIASRKLQKPVLIGHSLGGTLSLGLAAHHPDLLGGVVAIDGLPLFPGTEGMDGAQRRQMAEGARMRMANLSAPMFSAQQQQYMRSIGVTDMARADELAKLVTKSDPSAVAEYMVEALATDLRSALPAITVPVLLISPYFAPDAAQRNLSEAAKTAYYTALMDGTAKLKVVSVAPARHFVMIDQPELVANAIGDYLAALPR